MMKIHMIEARDLPDLWFQAVYDVLDKGKRYKIDKGSYEGQTRLEYDYFVGHVKYPGTLPLLPEIPESIGIPNPVEYEYVFGGKGYSRSYIEYLMTAHKEKGESYTYGSRLINVSADDNTFTFDQIEHIIEIYKTCGYNNNQMVLQIAKPSDLLLNDPPCLRSIGCKIQENKLHFIVHFRSWDLWGGMPANLAAIQTLKEYMAGEIGVEDGEMIVESKGLHLYGYVEKFAKLRCLK